jgi:hypothetical protein
MSTEEQDFLNTLGAKKGIVRKICAKLANHRNHIAHWWLDRSITMEEVKIISMLALKIIEKFRGFLQEAIEQKRYCKSK